MRQIDLINDRKVLPTGTTIWETGKAAGDTLSKLYNEAWNKGIAIPYQDERCKTDKEFIMANPDGSEDLAILDTEAMKNTIVKRLAEPGKGKHAHLIRRKSA